MIEIIPNMHPFFVHFTVALLLTSTALFFAACIFKNNSWVKMLLNAAYLNLWIGCAVSIITIIAGFYAFNSVNHDEVSHQVMKIHRNFALVTAGSFIILGILSFFTFIKTKKCPLWFLCGMVASSFCLLATGWYGGELVYRYGLGVQSLPSEISHDHKVFSQGHGHNH